MSKPKIATEFQRYLDLVKLDRNAMPAAQLRETQLAFYAGAGQMLAIITEIAELSEEEGTTIFNSLIDESYQFWESQS